MNEMIKRQGMGWIPNYPDFRDYAEETEEVKSVFVKMKGDTGAYLSTAICIFKKVLLNHP